MAGKPKSKHLHPNRRYFGPHIRPALLKYTALVGEVTWASNNLHAEFLCILEVLIPDDKKKGGKRRVFMRNQEVAQELWHSLKSDDAQRAALRAFAKHTTFLSTPNRKSLLWAIDSAGRLSEYRNDAIHTAFIHDDDGRKYFFTPSHAGSPKRVEKLERVGYARLFKALIGDLNQLSDYCVCIWLNSLESYGEKPSPLPRRPVLQSVLLVQKSPPVTSIPTRRRPRRKRQPQASRA